MARIEFQHVGSVENPFPNQEAYWEGNYWDFEDAVESLILGSTIIKLTLRDGSFHWASEVNLNLGKCSCCQKFSLADVRLVEGFNQ